jgi:hypothetical protein
MDLSVHSINVPEEGACAGAAQAATREVVAHSPSCLTLGVPLSQ